MTKKFTRTIENFTCQQCKTHVTGNGYTNHCPHCLWSKHVDINPGDRAHSCTGLMEPIQINIQSNETIITHQCTKCGTIKKNKNHESDSTSAILAMMKKSHI
ncbi:MAG: hypothetical protein A3H59_03800 [Candidatus Jacksonbacteria bacterium RIFCSPLOWO2_02_FULL_43_9]|nr:MAG: hypothetical protein A3B94_00080 [Candidatus Jacksonbacteria bacterium RIFCSPHIGHO2_02_FULL_43_10]OGY70831.1 MAG: hypothetical protein A2986_00610 [Candidatus Jacksonbacteria bacterium RIFCSPLOWO2_01_FULL_44_13]OGY72713.1 MAG: hypothetical protein A3H59_03800 [Candidatus Jacksonbacteria bacterium RIFCSPLOWO2_02_FULL_43_9]HAZ17087.1 hypothetical protein [Candidatus Jacksonbacteria bacterium]